ncbi:hypothetical protein SAMN05518849_12242 [Sphingobium sp. AP50]|nr:hypothetical protein SAMN05518849_12242 [Sphingobium sp. AP50]
MPFFIDCLYVRPRLQKRSYHIITAKPCFFK